MSSELRCAFYVCQVCLWQRETLGSAPSWAQQSTTCWESALHADSWPPWYTLTQTHSEYVTAAQMVCSQQQHLDCIKAEETLSMLCLLWIVSVVLTRRGDSRVGHCLGTAWHIASVLLLSLPSFMITRFTGECMSLLTQQCCLIFRPWR